MKTRKILKTSKKGNIVSEYPIILILGLIFLILVIMFIMKIPIIQWAKDFLPRFGTPKSDNISSKEDVEVPIGESVCAKGDFVWQIGEENKFVFFDGKQRNYDFSLSEGSTFSSVGEGEDIFFEINGKKEKAGIISKEGIVIIEPRFFDLNDYFYQKKRIEGLIEDGVFAYPYDYINDFKNLEGSKFSGANKVFCNKVLDIPLIILWPEKTIGLSITNVQVEKGWLWGVKSYSAVLPQIANTPINFYKLENYIILEDGGRLGLILPDGSVWLYADFIFVDNPTYLSENKNIELRQGMSLDASFKPALIQSNICDSSLSLQEKNINYNYLLCETNLKTISANFNQLMREIPKS